MNLSRRFQVRFARRDTAPERILIRGKLERPFVSLGGRAAGNIGRDIENAFLGLWSHGDPSARAARTSITSSKLFPRAWSRTAR
jgi:hypothetical protein